MKSVSEYITLWLSSGSAAYSPQGTILAAGETASIGYSLDKVSLAKNQVLRVYFYENGGQREMVLTIDQADINKAKTAL